MAAGLNGFGPVCQHGDISANEEEEQRRETRGSSGPLKRHKWSGSLLPLLLVITDLCFLLLKSSPVESPAEGLIGSAGGQNIYSTATDNKKNKHLSEDGEAAVNISDAPGSIPEEGGRGWGGCCDL